ncbi:hypothetical protein PIB30_072616 [Stylosanthes scabra]|uniref:Uncharacterized protein n=1 Tax=Stylosanthes scabra TaxID=79078 RepID=A0ABU6WS65_9FABA|nr:hypothetical protein [Stylosanthes scabra]
MVDASIVSEAGIAENVLVEVGELTIPADFHIIMPTKGDKGGRPQVLLGRPFLKTTGFRLQYDDDTFTFSVGKITEMFPVTPPPTPRKKSVHHFQICREEKKEKKEGLKPAKKKKKHEEVKSRKKKKHKEDEVKEMIALKCSSLGNLLGNNCVSFMVLG